jgi:hypothetical protein
LHKRLAARIHYGIAASLYKRERETETERKREREAEREREREMEELMLKYSRCSYIDRTSAVTVL